MRLNNFPLFIAILISLLFCFNTGLASTRQERKLINKGNSLYNDRKFIEAQSIYEQALQESPSSAEARYNLGLSQIRQVNNPADTTHKNRQLVEMARKNFSEVAELAKTKPALAAKANFNLGNIEFNSKEYAKAIEFYKQALRIDPGDEKARKNLRIAQLNLQKQNQDQQNQNQNQDQDKKDQDKQNQDQQQNQQNSNQDKDQDKQKDQDSNMSNQAASQILQAIDNKEAATRARVNKANTGEKAGQTGINNRRW